MKIKLRVCKIYLINKDGATVLTEPISQIFKVSIQCSIFPSDCKIVKLKPLFKKGPKTALKDYRPISLFPLVSKTTEKIIPDQTQSFLDKNDIFTDIDHVLRNVFPLIHVNFALDHTSTFKTIYSIVNTD